MNHFADKKRDDTFLIFLFSQKTGLVVVSKGELSLTETISMKCQANQENNIPECMLIFLFSNVLNIWAQLFKANDIVS